MPGSIRASAMTDGQLHREPRWAWSWRRRRRHRLTSTPSNTVGVAVTVLVASVAVLADWLAPDDPLASAGPSLQPPSWSHIMGTDNFGRDILAGVVHGLRTSMTLALTVIALSLTIGVLVGTVSGYWGGLVDGLLTRLTEIFQAIPLFFLALLVIGFFGAGLDNLILLLGLTSWELVARVVRADTLSLRQREFVEAARASGARDGRIIVRHILPAILPAAVVVISLVGARVILIEAALSFLGFGDPNTVSLGSLIFNAQAFLQVAWWMSVFPGVALALAVLGLNLMGDVVNEALEPGGRVGHGSRRLRPRCPMPSGQP